MAEIRRKGLASTVGWPTANAARSQSKAPHPRTGLIFRSTAYSSEWQHDLGFSAINAPVASTWPFAS